MKFLYYNDQWIYKYWLTKLQGEPSRFETNFRNLDWFNFYRINQMMSSHPQDMIQDRSGHVPHPCNIVTANPYEWRQDSTDFATVSLNTAKKIADSTDRPIAVLWSGGIDSTVALVALLQTVDWKRVTVVCDKKSVAEAPDLWENIIKPNLDVISLEAWWENPHQFFSVTGDAGDTTWAVLDHSAYEQHELFHKSWDQVLDLSLMENNKDFVYEFCSWSGRTIDTYLELRTWFYLCCKWQSKAMLTYYHRPGLTSKDACAFYDFDSNFNVWTMNNIDKIIGNTWQQYKVPAKKFIYDFDKNIDYYNNKEKEYSGSNHTYKIWHMKNNKLSFAIDENYNAHGLDCLPFMDMHLFENWNDQYQLIPMEYLS